MIETKCQFISILKPSRPNMHTTVTEEEEVIFEKHCEYLEKEFSNGNVSFAGTSFEDQDHFAIIIINAENKAQAENIINTDPAIAKGLLISKLSEFNTFLK